MPVALTRPIPSTLVACQLTHLGREPIDVARARRQHERYEETLRDHGWRVERLPGADELPDSVFVEDTAIVVDEVAVITRPGASSRRPETPAVASALEHYRPLRYIEEPGTLDGGDVLRIDRALFVGLSSRTNDEGARQLARHLDAYGYRVRTIAVHDCLHLKSAVTSLGSGRLLCNPAWIEDRAFDAFERIEVHPDEPYAANVLDLGEVILCSDAHPRTAELLARAGHSLVAVPMSELAKAEGGLTCCAILVR